MSDILFELGTEELPPKALNTLGESLYNGVIDELIKLDIGFDQSNSRWFASPRRLAFIIKDIDEAQADKKMQRRGPALAAAFDGEGNPKPAAIGFAKSVNREVSDLQTMKTDKGEWLVCDIEEKGKKTADLLPEFIQNSIKRLPIPKPMRWGDHDFSFIRPVHWLILLQNQSVLPFEMFGLKAGNTSRGHRFHYPDQISIESAATYVDQLKKVRVEVDQITRKSQIKDQVLKVAQSIGGHARTDDSLLDEVTAIVEYPVAVVGSFDTEFLKVPPEALISSMQKHQKYFPVFDNDQQLMPNFIALANIESSDEKQVIKGFEKVIRPRLADARFFWEQDQKQPLDSRFAMLGKMTFEQQLGTIADKCHRIQKIMSSLSKDLNLNITQINRVATLAKCDLVTDMVDEFPDLQGIMGGYYAAAQTEDQAIATAISHQYKPAFSGDTIPKEPLAQALSIADKMDTLCGIFSVGKKPTGNKDPFALRRASLGVIKILQQGQLPIDIYQLIQTCLNLIEIENLDFDKVQKDIEYFINQRLKHSYLEQQFSHDVVEAVLAVKPGNLYDAYNRVVACGQFKKDVTASALAAANKRSSNILRKATEPVAQQIDEKLMEQDQEQQLLQAINAIEQSFHEQVKQQNYDHAFSQLASLAQPVDDFFENVMVNSEDVAIRLNRLALLKKLNGLFNAIADISLLEI